MKINKHIIVGALGAIVGIVAGVEVNNIKTQDKITIRDIGQPVQEIPVEIKVTRDVVQYSGSLEQINSDIGATDIAIVQAEERVVYLNKRLKEVIGAAEQRVVDLKTQLVELQSTKSKIENRLGSVPDRKTN